MNLPLGGIALGAVDTPFARAKATHDEREGRALVREQRAYVLALLGFLIAAGGVGFALLENARVKTLPCKVPYYIALDELGGAKALGVPPTSAAFAPGERNYRYYLRQFVWSLRTVTTDARMTEQLWFTVATHCTAKCATYVDDYVKKGGDPTKRAERETVTVEVVALVPLPESDGAWQIDWKEHPRELTGQAKDEEVWRAVVHVTVQPPTTEAALARNPIGIYVTDLHWDKVGT